MPGNLSLLVTVTSDDFELPTIPSLPSPKLPKDFKIPSPSSSVMAKPCPPQYIAAVCDYCSQHATILSFKTGDHGVLLRKGSDGWWGVKIGKKKGWVPASYWHILQVILHKFNITIVMKRKIGKVKLVSNLQINFPQNNTKQ